MARKVPTQPAQGEYVIDYDAITYGDVKRIREIIASSMDSNDRISQLSMLDEIEQIVMRYITNGADAENIPHIVVQQATTAVMERLSYRKSLGK